MAVTSSPFPPNLRAAFSVSRTPCHLARPAATLNLSTTASSETQTTSVSKLPLLDLMGGSVLLVGGKGTEHGRVYDLADGEPIAGPPTALTGAVLVEPMGQVFIRPSCSCPATQRIFSLLRALHGGPELVP